MSADAFVATWSRPARLRSIANAFAIGLPLSLAAAAIGWRTHGTLSALVLLIAGLVGTAAIAALHTRRFDRRWLVRQLDSTRPDMEDSADLLLAPAPSLNPLQRLQQARLHARLESAAATALRPGWSTHAITAASIVGIAVIAIGLLWPGPEGTAPLLPTAATRGSPPKLVAQRLLITPPAYTGLPIRQSDRLDARAPVGSRLAWTLRFAAQPAAADLVLLGGQRVPLTRAGDGWTATLRLDRSTLYRVGFAGMTGPLHRIDVIPDTPPVIRVVEPERTLTPMTRGQQRWSLAFDVTDDHGVAPAASLRLIVTSGEGENIGFRETSMALTGSGAARRKAFRASLDIAALGLTPGNDIVAQLIVADNRPSSPQRVRSPSLILRWPPDLGKEAGGMDGMVKTVLPAYFRSQRQVIIDAEALEARRRRLPAATFAQKSDEIGVDQRALRLRYGALLGDETSDAPVLPTSDTPEKPKDAADGHAAGDGHDHGPPKQKVFGNPMDVLADYGHAHGEAAGLLDAASAALLRQAVDAMWQSELNLRQGTPDKALPHAYLALRLIKKVQQATRIYLARTGPELPPIDLTRRMTGERKGLGTPSLALLPRTAGEGDAVPAAAWRTLAGSGEVRLDALQRWLMANTDKIADSLAFAAAIDAVARDPACTRCRDALRRQLWAVIAPPPAQVPRRPAGDAIGRRYLDTQE